MTDYDDMNLMKIPVMFPFGDSINETQELFDESKAKLSELFRGGDPETVRLVAKQLVVALQADLELAEEIGEDHMTVALTPMISVVVHVLLDALGDDAMTTGLISRDSFDAEDIGDIDWGDSA